MRKRVLADALVGALLISLFVFFSSASAQLSKEWDKLIDAPEDESYMSGGFGHVAAANKVFLNWLLSKEGQLKWQEKSDNNSLRTDIAKNMLSDPTSIPMDKGKYVNTSLPQYQDIDAALKIVDDALAKAGKK